MDYYELLYNTGTYVDLFFGTDRVTFSGHKKYNLITGITAPSTVMCRGV